MTELLLKLKKDGKCIGYMHIRPSPSGGCLRAVYREPHEKHFHRYEPPSWKRIDSIHPFVCKDHHGRDVFEGDQIRGLCTRQKHQMYNRFSGVVQWSEQYRRFEVTGKDADGDLICSNFGEIVLAEIELVPAQEGQA